MKAASYSTAALIILLAMPRVVVASFSNGDFSTGLDGWTSSGDVAPIGGTAVLGDDDATLSALFQPVPWPAATFTLEFDFQNGLSSESPDSFPDSFFASIYFTDDPGSFDPVGGFDSVTPLFDMDANGTFNVTGTITPSGIGPGWFHYAVTLPNSSAFLIPYFELQDLNVINADSTVAMDNFQLVVPEPGTLGLGLSGGLVLLARVWRRRSARG